MTIQPLRLVPIGDAAAIEPTADACGCGGGSCSAGSAKDTSSQVVPAQRELLVEGMTCAHCVRSVTEELTSLDGVSDVEIDLVAGGASHVRLRTSTPVSDDALTGAIEEAGYRLV